jgi:hypothetical protein
VFKKVLQIAVSLSLLIGGYAGYTRLFAVAAALLGDARGDGAVPFPEIDSASARRANELARESFGPGHWAARKDLKLHYYEAARGFYMYAENYERLNDGKRLHIWPFAEISVSADGKARKMTTSDEAVIDLSQPFGVMKPNSEPSHIVHATLLGNVRIRDDKGTRDDPTDDLQISHMDAVDYDDKTLQITSASDLILEDRDLRLTGIGMMIQLRRKIVVNDSGGTSGGSGFETETAFVYKDVHIIVNNVGSNGILPGTAKPEKTGKTPLDLRCQNEMRIDFPKARAPVWIGPPDLDRPPDPTFAKFRTNVRVLRGTEKLDQLNCDTLDLTLMPNPKPPVSDEDGTDEDVASPTMVATLTTPVEDDSETDEVAATPASTSGPLTDLKLRKAIARGDAVWLQSEASGLVARCSELHYEKHVEDGTPDVTYLNGGLNKKLWVEKVDYDNQAPTPGTIKSIMRLISIDATIFDFGPGGTSKILARGPGKTEERPARNASVARTAWFEDEMQLLTWRDGEATMPTASPDAIRALKFAPGPPPKGTLRRLVTLTGVSKLVDHNSATTLDARRSIVAEFQSAPKEKPDAKDGPTEIKWLDAYEDAHLTAPSRTLTARQFLKAKFETPPAPPKVPAPAAMAGPIVATNPTPTAEPAPDAEPTVGPPPAPEPAIDGRADRVWAAILLAPSEPNKAGDAKSKGELKNAQLRGGVMVHQDPAPGKPLGSNLSGEALDVTAQGNGLMEFKTKAEEPPQAFDPKTMLASDSRTRRNVSTRVARVEFEGKIIESVDIIGLNQKLDFAWSNGAGIYIQLADRGLLDDKGIEGEKVKKTDRPTGPNPKDQLVITWTEEMRFYGKSRDLNHRPVARIEFRGTSKDVWTPDGKTRFRRGVEAKMTNSLILCDSMDVYMDRTIDLNKDSRKPAEKKPDEAASTDAQIAMLDCRGRNVFENKINLKYPGVDVINEKFYPDTGEFKEKQRIQSEHVVYDKRTGEFEAPGPGTTWLYKRKAVDPKNPKKPPAIELTKVKYTDRMQGRFGVAKDQAADNQYREAVFFGAAESANATVSGSNRDIDFDHPVSRDYTFLSSDEIHVYTEPPPVGSKESARQLLNARGNSAARTIDSLIQADLITYDSASQLTYAYGQDGKEVSLSKQESLNQPASKSHGKTLRYNKTTRESEFHDPQVIEFTDLKSGFRPKAYFPELGGSPKPPELPKQARLPFQKNSRSSTERKSASNNGQ